MKIYEVKINCNHYKMLVGCDDYEMDDTTHYFLYDDCPNKYIMLRLHRDECDVNFVEEVEEEVEKVDD